MTTNLFDYFEELRQPGDSASPWAARTPRRPSQQFDLKLFPRVPAWRDDADALAVLEEVESQPWVASVVHARDGIEVRLDDGWIESAGATLEAGGGAEVSLKDLAAGRHYSVQFWDANATKALHAGHMRNLAIGNALASALTQAGGHVERRSLISDVGRSMGEAMAGVVASGRHGHAWPDGDEKSDHFVGLCYAEYVGNGGGALVALDEQGQPEDSLTRELQLQNDAADELVKRVLSGDREALELWYKTRAWVIAGQRKTLARLGIAFDRVFFESDYLDDITRLTETGLKEGRLKKREDGVIVYATGLEDFKEFPLVRADGLPTQHMRALAYWMAAPELGHMTSMQVCGTEWVSHVTCRRKLMDELLPSGNGGMHPRHDIFHGMVARQKRAFASSEGALLIDDLMEWIEQEIDSDSERRHVRREHPSPERVAAQVALGFFLPHDFTPQIDFEPQRLMLDGKSLGWDVARAHARHGTLTTPAGYTPPQDPDYRFAVVQSELYRRHLRLAVERLEVRPLAQYLGHMALWYLEEDRNSHVERVVHTLLDRSARGLGLGAGR